MQERQAQKSAHRYKMAVAAAAEDEEETSESEAEEAEAQRARKGKAPMTWEMEEDERASKLKPARSSGIKPSALWLVRAEQAKEAKAKMLRGGRGSGSPPPKGTPKRTPKGTPSGMPTGIYDPTPEELEEEGEAEARRGGWGSGLPHSKKKRKGIEETLSEQAEKEELPKKRREKRAPAKGQTRKRCSEEATPQEAEPPGRKEQKEQEVKQGYYAHYNAIRAEKGAELEGLFAGAYKGVQSHLVAIAGPPLDPSIASWGLPKKARAHAVPSVRKDLEQNSEGVLVTRPGAVPGVAWRGDNAAGGIAQNDIFQPAAL